jgi:hypothetical protein
MNGFDKIRWLIEGLVRDPKTGRFMKGNQSGVQFAPENPPVDTPPEQVTQPQPGLTDQQVATSKGRDDEPGAFIKTMNTLHSLDQIAKKGMHALPVKGQTYYDQDNVAHKFGDIKTGMSGGQPGYFEFQHKDGKTGIDLTLHGTATAGQQGKPIPLYVKHANDPEPQAQQPEPEQPKPQERRDPKTGRYIKGNQSGVQYAPGTLEEQEVRDTATGQFAPGNQSGVQFAPEEPTTVLAKFQKVIKDFFGKPLSKKRAVYISKNPKDRLLKHMGAVDPEINFKYDDNYSKLRQDQIVGQKQGKFGTRHFATGIEPLTEEADITGLRTFADTIGLAKVEDEQLTTVLPKWTQFIDQIKNYVGWDYGISYDKKYEEPEEKQIDDPGEQEQASVDAPKPGSIYGYLQPSDPSNPNSNYKIVDTVSRPKRTMTKQGTVLGTTKESYFSKLSKLTRGL